MLRKILLAAAAASSLGLVALAPTTASAHWHGGWKGGFHGGYGFRPYVRVYSGYDSCYRKRVFYTAYGPVVKWVNVCAY
jgi:hypothetical protein